MSTRVDTRSTILAETARQLACTSSCASANEAACSSGTPIPQYHSLINLITSLRTVLFPRFSEPSKTQMQWDPETLCAHHLELVQRELTQLICQSFITAGTTAADADEIALQYILKLPEIRNHLLTDMQAAYDGDPSCQNTDEVVLCYPGFTAVAVYRLAHVLHRMNIPLLPRMMTEWVHGNTGIDIHPGATIGNHFFIDHGTGVVIGETCVIGEHVKIYQGVTLGALSFPKDDTGQLVRNSKRHPTIEDNVVIYANATVLGGNTVIGHDSVIGSSVWLVRSVEPFTTVTMEKPKLRMRNETPSEFEPPLNYQI